MKILDDGTRVGESAEERRRVRQAGQDALDALEYRVLVGSWKPGDPEPIGIIQCPPLLKAELENLARIDRLQRWMDSFLRIPSEIINGSTAP